MFIGIDREVREIVIIVLKDICCANHIQQEAIIVFYDKLKCHFVSTPVGGSLSYST
jgi:hypothetical protein